MSALDFLSPDLAAARDGFEPTLRSALSRALGTRGAELGIEDITLSTGKIELRGDLEDLDVDGAEIVRITPRRALVLCDYGAAATLREKLRQHFFAIDVMAALAGVRIERPDAERLMHRLTELDLDSLPAVGSLAHIQAYVLRDGETSFRFFFPQEYGDYVGEVVLDAAEGLE